MSASIEIHADTLSVFGLQGDADADTAKKTIEDAFRRFAERLARSPFARSGVKALALERLTIDTLPADELLSPRGAERLADELYAALTRRLT